MKIGKIEGYYGGLEIEEYQGKFFWWIPNHSFDDVQEIPESLYRELIQFHMSQDGSPCHRRNTCCQEFLNEVRLDLTKPGDSYECPVCGETIILKGEENE